MKNQTFSRLLCICIGVFFRLHSYSQSVQQILLFDKLYEFKDFRINYSPDSTVYVVLDMSNGINNVKLITKTTEVNNKILNEGYFAQSIRICVSNDSRYFISRLIHEIGSDRIYVNEYYLSSGELARRDTIQTRYLEGWFVSSGDFILQYTIANEPNSMILSKTFKFQLIDTKFHDMKNILLERGYGITIKRPYSIDNKIVIPFTRTDSEFHLNVRDSTILIK